MKKATLSPDALALELSRLAVELVTTLRQCDDEAAFAPIFGDDPRRWHEEFFSTGRPEPAASWGQGARATILVGWIWPADVPSGYTISGMVRGRLAEIPGVEAVSEPDLEPQLKLIWSVRATLRLTQ